MCESTPDVSHTDQMAFMVRYVTTENSIVQVKESFLHFFPLHGKTAAGTIQASLDEVKQNDLDVMMCRGQEYDSASALLGTHVGVQRRIKDLNPKALFVPSRGVTGLDGARGKKQV